MMRWMLTPTPAIVTGGVLAKNSGTDRPTVGSQITGARPISASSRLTVTTILISSEVPSRPRINPRSMIEPKIGATTATTKNRASQVGSPQPSVNCQ